MKVFISWSGQRSHAVAKALRRLITDLFDDVSPWVSSSEIGAGERWSRAVGTALQESNFGILCCTLDNTASPWLLFEAGALAKSLDDAYVVPYLVDVSSGELASPIKQFQGVTADEEGTWDLVKSVNRRRPSPRDKEQLERQFDRWWNDMREALHDLPATNEKFSTPMQEMLGYLREEAVDRKVRRGFAVWAPTDDPVEELDDLLHPPRIDKWSALILSKIINPLIEYHNTFGRFGLTSAELRKFLEANPPDESNGTVSLSHASEYVDRATKAMDDMKEARTKVQEVFHEYFERFSGDA
jgi:hypothetical protein